MSAPRITVENASKHLAANPNAKFVCAYEEAEQCRKYHFDGATPMHQFSRMTSKLPKDTEIIFYCACTEEHTAAERAEEYIEKGFTNAKALKGGYHALKKAMLAWAH